MSRINEGDVIYTMHKQVNYMTMSARHVPTGLVVTEESYTQDKTMNQMRDSLKEKLSLQMEKLHG